MSRSGYSDDLDPDDLDPLELGRWRGNVNRALAGKRGQAFLRELRDQLDAMPDKRLISDRVVDKDGCVCTLGVMVQARQIDPDGNLDLYDPGLIGNALGIARPMAAEIIYENDECGGRHVEVYRRETPEERWRRMRSWVDSKISN
jgi:hypothetical protein